MNIWTTCEGEKFIRSIHAQPWRVVEAQHILSTRNLVDSSEEHDLLELLLEKSKPSISHKKHYLIFTPFRYPPLKYGSRFGSTHEASLWYGSLELKTAFAEVAFYRFKFLNDTEANLGSLEVPMTAFTAQIKTDKGLDLSRQPFNQFTHDLSDGSSYQYSQSLGTQMRGAGVEAFIYYSARKINTKNIAAFTPDVFGPTIQNQQTWLCLGNKNCMEFTRIDFSGKQRFSFSR